MRIKGMFILSSQRQGKNNRNFVDGFDIDTGQPFSFSTQNTIDPKALKVPVQLEAELAIRRGPSGFYNVLSDVSVNLPKA